MQNIVAMQVSQNKHNLVPKVKKINKSNKIDVNMEHEKETQREYKFSTKEYEEVFMHNKQEEIVHKPKAKELKEYTDVSETIEHHIKDIQI
jgi:hypothetical protein